MDSDNGYGIQIGFNMDNYQAINISDIAIIEKEEVLSINTSKEEAEKIAEEAELLENEILQKDTFLTGNFRMLYKLQSYKKGILDGPVIFYNENQEEIAKGIYKNNLPWEGQFMDDLLLDEKGDIYMVESEANLAYHIYPNYQLSSPPSYQNLLDGYSIFFKKQTAYTFVKGEDTPICSMELRDSEFHEGVFIESDSNNNFNYSIFKDGERIVKIRDISLEEVREKVKELQE